MLTPASSEDASVSQQRQALLTSPGILDTAADSVMEAMTQAAAAVTLCPIAMISVIDGGRLALRSRHGLAAEYAPRAGSFCTHAAAAASLMQVEDATNDDRFVDHPLVAGECHVRFYAGHPIFIDGLCIGTLGVMDTQPRVLDGAEEAGLQSLGVAITALLVERYRQASGQASGRASGQEDGDDGDERAAPVDLSTVADRSALIHGEFMSRVSHELRTPLNAVLGFAQLLRANGATQPRSEIVRSATQIVRAGGHLLSLIDDLLGLANIDAGHPDLQLGPVALLPLVQRATCLIEAHADAQQMHITVSADPHLPTVHGDARAIQQVLVNLLGNAIRVGQPRTAIAITLAHEAAAGIVSFAVADHGLGIAADKLAAIFEPFTRVHPGSPAQVSSGLGLAISQKLTTAMGGKISVASASGGGSVFTVRLPIDGRAAPSASPDSSFAGLNDLLSPLAAGAASLAMPATSVAVARVLYIEDDPVNALLMQEFFEAMPRELASAVLDVVENGRDGLRIASKSLPSLILLDMNLPDLHGSEVLRGLRADPRTAGIPVIAVSADAMAEQILGAKHAGFDGYWTKPVDIRLVHAELARRFAAPQPAN